MKCFYHNDLDGRCAGHIVSEYEDNKDREDFIEVDYEMDLMTFISKIKDNEVVYFVDYSFKESNLKFVRVLQDKNCKIIWCDHHKSSLELEEEYPELKDIDGIRRIGSCGAVLIYEYLHNVVLDKMPKYIKLVNDYDCWIYEFGDDTKYFKLGVEVNDFDALDIIWKLLKDELFVHEVIADGVLIKNYIDVDNESHLRRSGYESNICGEKCYVINRSANSWIFGDKIKEYDYCVVYYYTGNMYKYSIYSEKDYTDCSAIAKKFGGGGHKGASGFSAKENIFER